MTLDIKFINLASHFWAQEEDSKGEVAEWLKAHAWKACIRATVSGVRIPSSPHLC